VGVGVGTGVAVGVGLAVGVAVATGVAVGTGLAVGVAVGPVAVGLAVGRTGANVEDPVLQAPSDTAASSIEIERGYGRIAFSPSVLKPIQGF
jgi:hypothetical protein